MNVRIDALAAGTATVENGLVEVGIAISDAMRKAAQFIDDGLAASARANIPPGLIGSVLDYAGRMQADLGHAALMLQGLHASLHEALERLAPDEAQRGGGGKEPPPKP